jgi:hypothetical protein
MSPSSTEADEEEEEDVEFNGDTKTQNSTLSEEARE